MKIALHICCAVCAAGAAEKLIQLGYTVKGFFYNPNIYPPEEYYRRLEDVRKISREMEFELIEGPFNPEIWAKETAGLENEREGGKRCPLCFKMRLEETYRYMLESGCDSVTSTITMGSNKPALIIARIGREVAGDSYADIDFKKKEGIKRANVLAAKYNLYRQCYCGCSYSKKAEEKRRSDLFLKSTEINLTQNPSP
jgi:epoxyqueuosine reductase